MSYAGCDFAACANESLQIFPDSYFHANSIESINEFVTNGGGTSVSPADRQPHAGLSAGLDFTIPKHTPFELTAAAADGDAIRYCREEFDLGATNPPNDDSDGQPLPILRSFPPVLEASRTFPDLGYILAFSNDPPELTYLVGQSLPMIGRAMTFRVTARDGHGGVFTDDMQLRVDGVSGPFAVTSRRSPAASRSRARATATPSRIGRSPESVRESAGGTRRRRIGANLYPDRSLRGFGGSCQSTDDVGHGPAER